MTTIRVETAHRFDLETALRLAQEAAPHITVNGFTVAQATEERPS